MSEKLIRQLISEVMITVGEQSFDVPDDKIDALKNFITSPEGLSVQPYDAEGAFNTFLESIDDESIRQKVSNTVENGIPKSFRETVSGFLSNVDPSSVASTFYTADPTGEVSIPEALRPLADYRTSQSSGAQIGRGELVIPFLFQDGKLAQGGNALYDVDINGVGWHVKQASPTSGVKMGSARDKLVTNAQFYQTLVTNGIPANTFNDLGQKDMAKLIPDFIKILDLDSPKDFMEVFTAEAREIAVGDAGGIIWYNKGNLIFTPKDQLHAQAITQGRFVMTTVPDKPLNYVKESLIREFIRETLITEAFTKTDEKAIEVMARKQIDKKWKEHEKKIDKMFDERDKTLFRNDAFYKVIARIYQELQRAYAEDQFKYATRYTRKDIPLARFRPS